MPLVHLAGLSIFFSESHPRRRGQQSGSPRPFPCAALKRAYRESPERRNYLTSELTSDLPSLAHCNAPGFSRRLLNTSSLPVLSSQSSPDSQGYRLSPFPPHTSWTCGLEFSLPPPPTHHHLFLRPTIFASRVIRLSRRQLQSDRAHPDIHRLAASLLHTHSFLYFFPPSSLLSWMGDGCCV